jgi:hypothetical protein
MKTISVDLAPIELLALIQIVIKASEGNKAKGDLIEANRLEKRAKELLDISRTMP